MVAPNIPAGPGNRELDDKVWAIRRLYEGFRDVREKKGAELPSSETIRGILSTLHQALANIHDVNPQALSVADLFSIACALENLVDVEGFDVKMALAELQAVMRILSALVTKNPTASQNIALMGIVSRLSLRCALQ
ncbi:MAG: hypothetical protein V1760_01550 [Candidatus Peregrinibacteria bacterium]